MHDGLELPNVKNGWTRHKFKEVCTRLVNGGTPPTTISNYWSGKIPWITGADCDGFRIQQVRRWINEEAVRNSATNVIEAGNLLLVTRTGVGKMAIAPFDVAISQDLTGIYLDPDLADVGFTFYIFQAHTDELKKLNQGTSINGILRSDLEEYIIDFPPLTEQRKIAHILTTLDDVIEQTEALIAKYQAIKQGMLHDLLTRGVDAQGHLRPSYDEAPALYKASPLGWIPQEWEVTSLGVVINQSNGFVQTGPFGSQLHAHEYVNAGIPVIMPQDIDDGFIKKDKIAYITPEKAQELSRHIVKVNDVVFARRGDLSRCAAIGEREVGWLCGTGSMLVRTPLDVINGRWLSYFYSHDLGQRQILGRAVGSTMVNLNSTLLKKLIIAKPKLNEQNRIVYRLDTLNSRIHCEIEQVTKLTLVKQGLMQDLLTGQVRVTLPEPED